MPSATNCASMWPRKLGQWPGPTISVLPKRCQRHVREKSCAACSNKSLPAPKSKATRRRSKISAYWRNWRRARSDIRWPLHAASASNDARSKLLPFARRFRQAARVEANLVLLIDIGNTHTHLGLANRQRVLKHSTFPTARWFNGSSEIAVKRFVGSASPAGACLCSVVPRATPRVRRAVKRLWNISPVELTPRTVHGVGINYPRPDTIGPDRLANAVAVKHHFGAPAVVVDFGTAVSFDVGGRRGEFVRGFIRPGVGG